MAVLKANGSFLKANGKILVRPEGVGDFVVIGGKKYPFVQIGRQLWIVYNLDYADENITVGGGLSTSIPKAYYYDQDEATNGWNGRKINLLYNVPALNYLVQNSSTIFPNGWRVCSNSDMESLIKFVGGASVAGTKLSKGDLDWQSASWNGTDDFGFRWLPSGTRWGSNGRFAALGEEAVLITANQLFYYTFGDGTVDAIFEHDLNAASPIRICKDATVNIGGRDYPTTRIGDQIWLAENLDWKLEGITINGGAITDTPAAWYFNKDEATYGINGNKQGLLYNKFCQEIISQSLPKGWRIPSKSDFEELDAYIGSNSAIKLKSTTEWPNNYKGTDNFGFKLLPSGWWDSVNPSSSNNSANCPLQTSTKYDTDRYWQYYTDENSPNNMEFDTFRTAGIAIRLVKDA